MQFDLSKQEYLVDITIEPNPGYKPDSRLINHIRDKIHAGHVKGTVMLGEVIYHWNKSSKAFPSVGVLDLSNTDDDIPMPDESEFFEFMKGHTKTCWYDMEGFVNALNSGEINCENSYFVVDYS